MSKIVVVEDDAGLREQVVTYLTLSGFDVVGASSAAELYRHMAVQSFDIVVLDLRLPDEDGLSIAAHLRAQSPIGIIMLTARTLPDDRARGFDAGADIYMSKPVEMRELVSAINSLTRRLGAPPAPAASPASPAWKLDRAAYSLAAPSGRNAPLTVNELSLMAKLADRPGAAVSRGELLAALGYDPSDPGNRNLDAALRRLRLKVELHCGIPLPLRTVHLVGYQFVGEIEAR